MLWMRFTSFNMSFSMPCTMFIGISIITK